MNKAVYHADVAVIPLLLVVSLIWTLNSSEFNGAAGKISSRNQRQQSQE